MSDISWKLPPLNVSSPQVPGELFLSTFPADTGSAKEQDITDSIGKVGRT